MIDRYREILENDLYADNNSELCDCFRRLGGMAFVRVGLTKYRAGFMRCFAHYAEVFARKWGESEKKLHSKHIGYKYVFELMLKDEKEPIKYDFRYILDETPNSAEFCEIIEAAFLRYWTKRMASQMQHLESLADVAARVGDVRLSRYLAAMPGTESYVKTLAARYTETRELISLSKLHNFIFGNNSRSNFAGCEKSVAMLLGCVVAEEFALQYEKFPTENHLQRDIHCDIWIFYAQHGPTLWTNRMDFRMIKSPSLRTEVKYYLKHRFCGGIQIKDRFLTTIAGALNLLCEINPIIHYFADIDETDARKLHMTIENVTHTPNGRVKAATNIMGMFSALKVTTKYLMGDHRDENIKSPRPHANPFAAYTFHNSRDFVKNTPVIPEDIMEKMDAHISELSEDYRLIYKIFSETGMRAKEVVFLEAGCVSKSRYENVFDLKYKPFKVLSARRRTNRPDYHTINITGELAEGILRHTEKTAALREEHCLPYIFLVKRKGFRANMINPQYFLAKLDELAKKHNLWDEDGTPWHFTARQYRKTLAVTLIENGGTIEELAYLLGHLSYSTASSYYAEVRKKRLAEMNSEFFRKKFELLLSGEQLSRFNEEERRLLYVDFCLSSRRVEFGHCVKKLSEGDCDGRSSLVNCVNCKNLCTGKKYLPYWKDLLSDQKKLVAGLLRIYQQNSLSDFHNFREYRQEQGLLDGYKNIVAAIESKGL